MILSALVLSAMMAQPVVLPPPASPTLPIIIVDKPPPHR